MAFGVAEREGTMLACSRSHVVMAREAPGQVGVVVPVGLRGVVGLNVPRAPADRSPGLPGSRG